MPLTATERSLRARIAAHTRWSKVPPADRSRQTAAGTRALADRFLAQAAAEHPDLPDTDLRKLADSLLRAYMCKLAFASAKARRARARAGGVT